VNKKAYSTWDAYEMAFLKQGTGLMKGKNCPEIDSK
jgi:hypothetical protein